MKMTFRGKSSMLKRYSSDELPESVNLDKDVKPSIDRSLTESS